MELHIFGFRILIFAEDKHSLVEYKNLIWLASNKNFASWNAVFWLVEFSIV
jgi:hypothetical protein